MVSQPSFRFLHDSFSLNDHETRVGWPNRGYRFPYHLPNSPSSTTCTSQTSLYWIKPTTFPFHFHEKHSINHDSGIKVPGITSPLHLSLSLGDLSKFLTSLCLGFILCKIGIINIASLGEFNEAHSRYSSNVAIYLHIKKKPFYVFYMCIHPYRYNIRWEF